MTEEANALSKDRAFVVLEEVVLSPSFDFMTLDDLISLEDLKAWWPRIALIAFFIAFMM
ncbi:hypothetical protein [Algoriphagus vanfongensis]|uniref:hypothetical protein n=1 Tax=Algoriphagus vanfongensis TaxID=426371 RepID=UPI0003FEFFEB|nr:hypothetical protein [Algoriphagus vanfongensis]